MDDQIKILLVDDHIVLRQGLRVLLDEEVDLLVVAEAGTVQEAIQQVENSNPDIVVMDLGLAGENGLDAIREIRNRDLPVKIVVLSMHSGRELVMQAIQAGSDGYVPKSSAHTDLIQAIRSVNQGQRYLHPAAATVVVDELLEKHEEAQLLDMLSEREKEVLQGTAMGFTDQELGKQLSLSPKTIYTYRQRAMEKLDLEHRSDLIQFALRAGLLDDVAK
jgi:two-component system response regulator NreC